MVELYYGCALFYLAAAARQVHNLQVAVGGRRGQHHGAHGAEIADRVNSNIDIAAVNARARNRRLGWPAQPLYGGVRAIDERPHNNKCQHDTHRSRLEFTLELHFVSPSAAPAKGSRVAIFSPGSTPLAMATFSRLRRDTSTTRSWKLLPCCTYTTLCPARMNTASAGTMVASAIRSSSTRAVALMPGRSRGSVAESETSARKFCGGGQVEKSGLVSGLMSLNFPWKSCPGTASTRTVTCWPGRSCPRSDSSTADSNFRPPLIS